MDIASQSISTCLIQKHSIEKIFIIKIIGNNYRIDKTLVATNEEYTLIANNVKLTFYNFPFEIPHKQKFNNIINIPSLLDLAAMKAYALGRSAKWKDYVDLYFIFKYYFSLNELCSRSKELFKDLFSEKLFRAQLSFFDDIDYSEQVHYIINPVQDVEIKEFLKQVATQPF
ncbi:MAG: hypothetical protein SCK70_02630 [bacterium]|nr:hypothetical protein [bacterium]